MDNLKERFVVGFCQAATPFSHKKGFDNRMTLCAKKHLQEDGVNFWEDGFGESLCYFGGGVLGLVCVPVDAIKVAMGDVKKTLKLS